MIFYYVKATVLLVRIIEIRVNGRLLVRFQLLSIYPYAGKKIDRAEQDE